MKATDMTVTQGNDQFYPTPPALAEKMLEGLDMNFVSTVLEPSAGKGDLVTAIARKNQLSYRNREIDVDCCEIDPYLRQILQYNFSDEKKQEIGAAQGYHTREYDLIDHTKLHVVHDDFLTYSSMKHYDLILMNPPFQDGAKHLLKALHMQRDGGLVICLLNAETLRNPYTDMRQDLVRMLQELNAEITFVDDAFRDAERSASVDAAIVRVHIPEAEHESEFWSRMKKAIAESDPQPDPELKALVAGDYIDQAITLYNTEVAATMEFVKEYRALVPYIYTDLSPQDKYRAPILTLTVSGDRGASGFDQQRYMRTVRLKYWRALFKNEKFVGRLTSNLRERYEKQVDRMADYEFSAFNIKQIMIEMNAEMTQGVEDSIMGLFDKLTIDHSWFPECKNNRHYYTGWATNKAHKVGKKCIVPENMFRDSWGYGSDYLDTFKAYKVLSDLEKSLDYLGGEGPDGYDLNARLECAKQSGQTRNIQLKYFAIDIFKKGTTHIKFYPETMKLVDRLNIYASQKKGWLPPRYGKARYKDMNDMEQMVVDSFHGNDTKGSGAKAYAEVMANAAFYLAEPTQKLPALMAAT